MRINASTINAAAAKATAGFNVVHKQVCDVKTDLITRIMLVTELARKGREALLWQLAKQIEVNMEVSEWTFSAAVKPYFEQFDTAEAKAFAKLDQMAQRRFAQYWSEVVSVTKKSGQSATARRSANAKKQKAQDAPPTYNRVRTEALALTFEEQERLVRSLAKQLGLALKAA